MSNTRLFDDYKTTVAGQPGYLAGLPRYPRNFSRDTLIAGIIAGNAELLASQLLVSAQHQGSNFNIITGEEPGKIHHEYPGVLVHPPYLTTYDACDTTALFLIGWEGLSHLDQALFSRQQATFRETVERAVAYLTAHTQADIFLEFPPPGAHHYSLHTTYWKDSIVPRADGGTEPRYPVAYALAHFQAARGMLAAGRLLADPQLTAIAGRMYRAGLQTFITDSGFCVERDTGGSLVQPSSDELHILAYLPVEYKAKLPLAAMRARVQELVTPAGIACTPRAISDQLPDTYHGYVVWIFEQALIHYGCTKFGLSDLADVAQRCRPYIGAGQELLTVEPQIAPAGNDRQLWSVAAKLYFSRSRSLRRSHWL